jgi:hypothetical protein
MLAVENRAHKTAGQQSAKDHRENNIYRLSWYRARKRCHAAAKKNRHWVGN